MKCRSLRAARLEPRRFTTLLFGSLCLVTGCGEEKPKESTEKSPAKVTFEAACKDGKDNDSDGKADCDDADCQSPGGECVAAPPLDRTVATAVYESAEYLFTGKNPLQKGVEAGVINKQQVALLRGRVIDAKGKALAGAKITVKGHAEYGYTYSRGDGYFDMAVNGGARLIIDYALADYLGVQRAVQPGWQSYVTVPDAGMIVASTDSTEVTSESAESQLILGVKVEDDYGKRQPLVLMEPGTVAKALLPNGKEQELDKFSVSITEYPITPGNEYLPGSSTSQGGLSYGLEFAVKEADALKAKHVAFSKPVSVYVENLADLEVGRALTVQHYDEQKGQWEPSVHGSVLQILDVSDGKATVDTDGDGKAEDSAQLDAQGITSSDLAELGRRFKAEQKLWHGEMQHFSAGLLQAQGTPPANAIAPLRRGLITKTLDAPTYAPGMVIETQASTHNEPIVGTPFSLHYQSNRTYSYGAGRTLEVPLVGDELPPGIAGINVRVSVAGRDYDGSFPKGSEKLAPNLRFTATWDGRNASNNLVQGQQVAEVTIAYLYPDAKGAHVPAVLNTKFKVPLGGWDARAFGLGGFAIDAFHSYDPAQQILYFGHGGQRTGSNVSLVAKSASGQPDFDLGTPDSLIVASDGSLILTDDQQNSENFGRVIRIGTDGMPSVLFGPGAPGDAADAELMQPQGVVVLSDGRLIVSDLAYQRIVELSPDGSLRTLVSSYEEDAPEFFFSLDAPTGLTLGPREELYFVDQGKIFRYEGGKVEVFAGGGDKTEDGVLATEAKLIEPNSVVVDPDNNVYVSERGIAGQTGGNCVRKILSSGVITTIAGTGTAGYSGDGEDAKNAQLNNPHGLALDADGQLYIVDMGNIRIRRITADGLIQTVIGGGDQPLDTLSLAVNAQLSTPDGIATGPDGSLYIATQNKVIRSYVGMPQLSATDHLVPSTDGRTLYRFDERGRHLESIDAMTSVTELKFGYSSAGLLSSITDKDGNITKIERDSSGLPSRIVAPYGQVTKLGIKSGSESGGDVESITDPLERTTKIGWTATTDGLIAKVEDPKAQAVSWQYDPLGRMLSNTSPAGTTTLARKELAQGWSIAKSTPGHGTSLYATEYGAEKWTRTVTYADQTKSVRIDAGAWMTRKSPDGTGQELWFAPDMAFGAQSLVTDMSTVTLPSGKEQVTTYMRAKGMEDLQNPLKLTSWVDQSETNGRWYESAYTNGTRKLKQTSPMGRVSEVTLDEWARPIAIDGPGLPTTKLEYDGRGRVVTQTQTVADRTRVQNYSYGDGGWVEYFVDPLKQKTKYSHDVVGRVTAVEEPNQAKTTWSYGVADNVEKLTPPGGYNWGFTYDMTTQLLTSTTSPVVTPANAGNLGFTYGPANEVTRISHADGRGVEFSYDTSGRLKTQKLAGGSINFGYAQSHLTSVNRSDMNVNLAMAYDGALLTSSTWSGGITGKVKFDYDSNLWLSAVTVNDASTVNLWYDDDGLLLAASCSAGSLNIAREPSTGRVSGTSLGSVSTQLTYSDFGELKSLSATAAGAALFGQNLERDDLGRVTQIAETTGAATRKISYTYNLGGRLATETRDGVTTTYTYDANGNRTATAVGTVSSMPATFDAQDRIVSQGARPFTHTAHGDLETITDGAKSQKLTYDELGNLTKVVVNSGSSTTTIEYVIDGMGRRVARRTNGNVDRIWLYRDGLRPVSEVDGKGVFTHFVYESNNAESGAPDALIRSGVLYRVVKDHLGSVRLVVNAQTGAIAQSIDYDAYGVVLNETGAGFQPFGFAGGLYDATTMLVRFGARDYDASTGRWTNRDPIGFAGGQGNQYLYVNGDPANGRDPKGLESFMCTKPLSNFDRFAAPLSGGTKEVRNTRSGPDVDGNLFYHQYICVARAGQKDVCGGQSGGGKMLGPGRPSHDSYSLYRCERVHDDNACLDKCLADAISSKERPYYSLFYVGGTNCQEWADETMARCERQCGVN